MPFTSAPELTDLTASGDSLGKTIEKIRDDKLLKELCGFNHSNKRMSQDASTISASTATGLPSRRILRGLMSISAMDSY